MPIIEMLASIADPRFALPGMVGLLFVLASFLAWNGFFGGNVQIQKRIEKRKKLATPGHLDGATATSEDSRLLRRRREQLSQMRRIIQLFSFLRPGDERKVLNQLNSAGLRSPENLVLFKFARVIGPFIGAFGAIVFLGLTGLLPVTLQNLLFAAIAGFTAGLYLPTYVLDLMVRRRQGKITKAIPDGLDLMIICAEAGLSLDAMFVRISREMRDHTFELADEFALTAVELGVLPTRRMAFENLVARVNTPEIRSVAGTLLQSDRYGTSISESLRVLAGEFRHERLMKAEEKAGRLPALMSIPLIFFIVPAVIIIVLTPAVLEIMDGPSILSGSG